MQEILRLELEKLQSILGNAQLYFISADTDAGLTECLPKATEKRISCARREEDYGIRAMLSGVVEHVAELLGQCQLAVFYLFALCFDPRLSERMHAWIEGISYLVVATAIASPPPK